MPLSSWRSSRCPCGSSAASDGKRACTCGWMGAAPAQAPTLAHGGPSVHASPRLRARSQSGRSPRCTSCRCSSLPRCGSQWSYFGCTRSCAMRQQRGGSRGKFWPARVGHTPEQRCGGLGAKHCGHAGRQAKATHGFLLQMPPDQQSLPGSQQSEAAKQKPPPAATQLVSCLRAAGGERTIVSVGSSALLINMLAARAPPCKRAACRS